MHNVGSRKVAVGRLSLMSPDAVSIPKHSWAACLQDQQGGVLSRRVDLRGGIVSWNAASR